MTLTVRLKPELETALELHCTGSGLTKSHVVQEALAEYLVRPAKSRSRAAVAPVDAEPSANYRAFEARGWIGCVDGVGPADKAGVRAAFARRQAAKLERQAANRSPVTSRVTTKARGNR